MSERYEVGVTDEGIPSYVYDNETDRTMKYAQVVRLLNEQDEKIRKLKHLLLYYYDVDELDNVLNKL